MDRKAMLLNMTRRILQPAEVCVAKGCVKRLAALDTARAMVYAARSAEASGSMATVVESLQKAGAEVDVWTGPSAEPTLEVVQAMARQAAEHRPDWIVAIGGGSIIDAAKLAWTLYEAPELDFAAEKPPAIPALRQKARFAAIPTTAGTGSEASQAAVLSRAETKEKLPIVSPQIVADLALLDPAVTTGLPAEQTMLSAVDALAHAMEAYTSRLATPLVRTLAAAAIRSIEPSLPHVLERPEDVDLRQAMLDASYLAGLSQSAASTGLAHALAHAAGAVLSIGHAAAIAVFLPGVLYFNVANAGAIYEQLAADTGRNNAAVLATAWQTWLQKVSAPQSLSDAAGRELSAAARERIVEIAKRDVCLRTNPCRPDDADLQRLVSEVA